ncbi:MAG: helix-turn-helix domain-containing protein [Bacteroidales bacterium]
MENPFELLEQRLASIEEKIDGLTKGLNNPIDPSSLSSTWVTTKQLSQHLGISTAAVTNIRGTKIPYYKVGGRILFKREEVDAFIQKSRYMSGGERLDEYLRKHQ